MSYTKYLDTKAKETAEYLIEHEIYKACEWALDDDTFKNLEGDEYNEAHGYMMKLVASKVASRLLVEKAD